MIRSRWHLPLLLGLLAVAAPLAANDTQQVLFNFVKPMAVVGITLEDADLPSVTAEATPEGDILRRVTFSPAQRPTLRMSPAQGRWDWSAADYVSLRIQNAMSWDMTLEVAIEGEQGAPGLQASIELPAGPPQTLLVPLRAVSPEALGMRAGPPMPQMVEGQRMLLAPRVEGSLDRARVGALSLSLRSPQAPQSILLGRFGIRAGRAVERSILTGLIELWPVQPRRLAGKDSFRRTVAQRLCGRGRTAPRLGTADTGARPFRRPAGWAGVRSQRFLPHGKTWRALVAGYSGRTSVLVAGR